MKAIIFDTETTDLTLPSLAPLDKQPRIIEVGAIVVDETGIIAELSQLINPGMDIAEKITKITGITNADLVDQPTFAEVLPQLRDFFTGSDLLICHNAPFDSALLRYELERLACEDFPWPSETICTVQEYLPLFGHRPKLTELYETVLLRPLAQTHRALDDVKALYEVLVADKFFQQIMGV